MGKIKWYAQTQWVDVDTGEIIAKKEKDKRYRKIKKTKTQEIKEYNNGDKYGITKYTIECERDIQTKLWE